MRQLLDKVLVYICFILGIAGVVDAIVLLATGLVINFGIVFPLVTGIVLIVYNILKIKDIFSISKIKNVFLRRTIKTALWGFIISFVLIEGLIFVTLKADTYTDVDYVVILGGGVKGGELTKTLQFRLDKGIEFLNYHPDLDVIVTGGKGFGETISEGEAMRDYLIKNGVPEEKIIVEDEATSTMENFRYSKKILERQTGRSDYEIMIITSDFHMLRSKVLAAVNGFKPYGIPANTWIGVFPNSIIREYFAIFKSIFVDIILGL